MGDDRLSLEQMIEAGWAINSRKGVELRRFASVSLCLMREEHMSVCIPGYGETRDDALADAVEEANAWIAREAAEEHAR